MAQKEDGDRAKGEIKNAKKWEKISKMKEVMKL